MDKEKKRIKRLIRNLHRKQRRAVKARLAGNRNEARVAFMRGMERFEILVDEIKELIK